MSEADKQIFAGGYSLISQGGRNILLSGEGNSIELSNAETQAVYTVQAEDFIAVSDAYSRALSEYKTRSEILGLAVSSYNFILHNEAVVRSVNAVLQEFASQFYDYINANPHKAERYIASLEDLIYAATRGEALKKGNVFGRRSFWQKIFRRIKKDTAEENIRKQAKILWRNISVNQELYSDYICGGGISFDGIIKASADNCLHKLELLHNQEESLVSARKQKEFTQKKVGILALQNYIAGKRYLTKENLNKQPDKESNVINFPNNLSDTKTDTRMKNLVFMNA